MTKVTRKKQETTLSLLKRFSRKIKQSGRIGRFKKNQFSQRKKSDLKKKRDAIKRLAKKDKLKTLYKLGKIDTLPQ